MLNKWVLYSQNKPPALYSSNEAIRHTVADLLSGELG